MKKRNVENKEHINMKENRNNDSNRNETTEGKEKGAMKKEMLHGKNRKYKQRH